MGLPGAQQKRNMRQALVITNPKWEPFTKVSDAFKNLKLKDAESAVLVVRGRCKEQRSVKEKAPFVKQKPDSPEALAADMRKQGATPDAIAKAVAAFKPLKIFVALFCLIGFTTLAQQPVIGNINGATTAGATTNTSAANGVIGWNIDRTVVFQAAIIGTNASPTNAVTVLFDTSDNGTDWLTDQYTFSITPNGTNSATAISRVTNSVGGKYLRFGTIKNPNLTAVTFTRFTMSLKDE